MDSDSETESKGPRSPSSDRSSVRSGSRSPVSDRSMSSKNLTRSPRSGPRSPSSGPRSPGSGPRSPGSGPRSPPSEPRSASSAPGSPLSGPRSPTSEPRSPASGPGSPASGPRSPVSGLQSPASVPPSPKSPDSRSRSPESRNLSEGRHSSSPVNSYRSNSLRSRSSSSSSRSRSNTPDRLEKGDGSKSPKSGSSRSSKKSSPDRRSVNSDKSASSRESRRARKNVNLDDGNTSDSSQSSIDLSSRKNRNVTKAQDTQAEEISDGDMESDHEKPQSPEVKKEPININHDDLSDVSDLDDSIGCHSEEEEEECKDKNKAEEEEEQVPIEAKPAEAEVKKVPEKTSKAEEGEEQLDFEAEDGECQDQDPPKENEEKEAVAQSLEDKEKKEEKEELEEGEVTDEDEARPEETEPRPVCRFFSRGQCTWGASCRFLHPGVTDKGNYTMFELIRPVIPGEYGREDRMYRPEPPMVESAWERGLRTAKEMLRKSMKRKEQDIDFEEKKMNLSLAQEEFDKENGYYARAPSPEPRYVMRHPVAAEYAPIARPPPEEYYSRRQVLYEPEYVSPRERMRTSYRELPPHRMPDYYNNKYEEEIAGQSSSKARRPKREVIVQKVPEERPQGRGDEWSDPWMRSKSPGTRKGRKRSYSSGSSYSSSSSSRSSSRSSRSSYSSRSRTSRHRRESRSHRTRQAVSPSVIVSERKAANERAALMNPPAPKKKALSPGMMRAGAQNPPAPSKAEQLGRTTSKLAIAAALARVKGRRRSSRSSSDSSGSSSSDSDSSGSSSSSSRDGSPPPRRVDLAMALKAQAIDALKGGPEKKQIKLNLKNPVGVRKPDAADTRKLEISKKRPVVSPPMTDPKAASNKKATSRREELLKQLKAVEDAIAKKRSKVN